MSRPIVGVSAAFFAAVLAAMILFVSHRKYARI
jgi:hypothetical protein